MNNTMKYYDKAVIIDSAVEDCKFCVICSTNAGSIGSKNIVNISMNQKNEEVFLGYLLAECPSIEYSSEYDNDGWVTISV